jgi:PucR C-terminal helix-turn-helix domain/GGDEF-like domain
VSANATAKGRLPSSHSRSGLVARLRLRSTEIEEAIVARIRIVGPESTENGDVQYEEGQRIAVTAILDYALTSIEHGEDSIGVIPLEVAAQAHRAARNGVELGTILRRYCVANAELTDFVTQEADHCGLLSYGAAFRIVQRVQARLLDSLVGVVNHEYAQEIKRVGRSPEWRRAELVKRLLADGTVENLGFEYELDAWHLGVVGTGVKVGRAFRGLATELKGRLMTVSPDEQSVWVWIGGSREVVVRNFERLTSARWPMGVSLAVGEPAKGLDGWRLTHRQAQDAFLVSLRQPQRLTLYADVALLAHWLRDDTRARGLVEMYLSALDNHRCPGATLRQTLREYFVNGRNSSEASRTLNISRRTMRNRMALIEESLGSLLNTHQAELELALRLDNILRANESRLAGGEASS